MMPWRQSEYPGPASVRQGLARRAWCGILPKQQPVPCTCAGLYWYCSTCIKQPDPAVPSRRFTSASCFLTEPHTISSSTSRHRPVVSCVSCSVSRCRSSLLCWCCCCCRWCWNGLRRPWETTRRTLHAKKPLCVWRFVQAAPCRRHVGRAVSCRLLRLPDCLSGCSSAAHVHQRPQERCTGNPAQTTGTVPVAGSSTTGGWSVLCTSTSTKIRCV